jgi:catechol 2,3-dioxygenase-like lactoylglutathione lyase family enzyme
MSITRFDHLVIAARHVPRSAEHYRSRLGFSVYRGGQHPGLGTENAIVRFGLDYMELLGIYDEDEAAAAPRRATLMDYFDHHDGGLIGYCLATDRIDELAERFRDTGLDVEGPMDMERMRPDGVLLQWRVLVPGGTAWRRPWPFFIQWAMDDAERLQVEPRGLHPNGGRRVSGIAVLVRELDAAMYLYTEQLGLTPGERTPLDEWHAESVVYQLGNFRICLVAPTEEGIAADALEADGEGVYAASIQVASVDQASMYLEAQNVVLEPVSLPIAGHALSTKDALGARFVLHDK